MDSADRAAGLVLTLIGIIAAVVAWLRWVRPKLRRGTEEVVAVRDAILGREALRDSITGREIQPALPGMGVRMAHQEEQSRDQRAQLQILTDAVTKIADSHELLNNIERRVAALEDAAVERVVTKVESAEAWRAIAAAHGEADDDPAAPPIEP